jgi:hypothetical protein
MSKIFSLLKKMGFEEVKKGEAVVIGKQIISAHDGISIRIDDGESKTQTFYNFPEYTVIKEGLGGKLNIINGGNETTFLKMLEDGFGIRAVVCKKRLFVKKI